MQTASLSYRTFDTVRRHFFPEEDGDKMTGSGFRGFVQCCVLCGEVSGTRGMEMLVLDAEEDGDGREDGDEEFLLYEGLVTPEVLAVAARSL